MATPDAPSRAARAAVRAEWLGAAAIVAALAYACWRLAADGYLPAPFMFNHDDTLMDGVNTAWWARHAGAYEVWRSVYPPIAFAWLRLFLDPACYTGDEFAARSCDVWLRAALIGCYLANVAIVGIALRRQDRATAWPRTVAIALGLPMLFALERGNLVLPAFAAFALAHGGLLRRARSRWLAAAIAANFKPYLLAPVFAALLRRRWRWFEGAMLTTILVYLGTLIVVGEGTPYQIVRNIMLFASGDRAGGWDAAYYASSWVPLLRYLSDSPAPLATLVGSAPLDLLTRIIPLLMHASQALALVAAAAIWWRPAGIAPERAALLATLLAIATQEVGGYGQLFALFLLFLQPARGRLMGLAIALGYLVSLPADLLVRQFDAVLIEESWLGGHRVAASLGVPLGTIVRPGLLLLIMDLVAIDSLLAVTARFPAISRFSLSPGYAAS